MKRLYLLLLLLLATPVMAQHGKPAHRGGGHQCAEVTEMVKDLSPVQKRKLENITKESRERVDALKKSQKQVRDSVALFMRKEGDQSKYLFPLFDREARLQAEISREMYVTKVRIDEILTKEQRVELQKACEKDRCDRRPPKR